jgi:site-specific recombinase XerC
MFDALDRDDPRDVRDRALLLVAWLGALRRSEVSALDVGDAVAVPQGIELTIRRDKTNQSGPPRVLGLARQAPPYCPVEALERWRAVLTAHGVDDGPLWRQLVAGRPAGRLSDRAVYDRVQAAARRAQLVASWGAHSMRSGALTEGANAGVPLDRLREHGRHASIDQTLAYVRPDIWTGNATFGLLAGRRVR